MDTLTPIHCSQEFLESGNYVEVRRGDVIGAVLPAQNYLPVVGNSSDGSLLLRTRDDDDPPSRLNLEEQSLALHLFVEIGEQHYNS